MLEPNNGALAVKPQRKGPHFMDLPPELRDEVYFHAMVADPEELVPLARAPSSLDVRFGALKPAGVNVSLFRLNHAIKEEVDEVFFKYNIFSILPFWDHVWNKWGLRLNAPDVVKQKARKILLRTTPIPGGHPTTPLPCIPWRIDIYYLAMLVELLPQLLCLRELHLAPISIRTKEETICLLQSSKGNDPRPSNFAAFFGKGMDAQARCTRGTMEELQQRPEHGLPAVRVHMCSLKLSEVQNFEAAFPMIEWLHVEGCTRCAGYYSIMKNDHGYKGYSDQDKLEAERWRKTTGKAGK
ncbi:hypothetical protein BU16DRAFT_542775 [Lophium mytilinum]|uniref:F-box domain-containing protein n=1 Tax=Lophium mytilinum TaxID=390894 RepID=A0A6A6QI41_9PEZI|nr:hypothetical protein BU16DRAFT_542775 [Lophium mytilinum]